MRQNTERSLKNMLASALFFKYISQFYIRIANNFRMTYVVSTGAKQDIRKIIIVAVKHNEYRNFLTI